MSNPTAQGAANYVWLVVDGYYEISVESVHASEASAKAWVVAETLKRLKQSLELDLEFADNAAARREIRRDNRERVAKVKAGDVSDFDFRWYREELLSMEANDV